MTLTKRKGCLLALIAAPLMLWGVYKLSYPSYTWHQKVTITIETPDGEVSGSAVQSVTFSKQPKILPDARATSSSVTGEAVVVDLGEGRYLFKTLGNARRIALATFASMPTGTYATDWLINPAREVARNAPRETPTNVPPRYHPLLVTFDDINDPASVKRVDPANLAASFGPGYALKSITLEITDEPVTEGKVEEVLGWLTWSRERLLEAGGGRNPVQLEIDGGLLALGRTDFRRK